MEQVTPIRPDQIGEHKAKIFPDFVLKAFNDLLAEKYSHGSAKIVQKDAVQRILQYGNMLPEEKSVIYNNGWLNVEEIYRDAGWKVKYDKPGYCESYDAFFEFSKK